MPKKTGRARRENKKAGPYFYSGPPTREPYDGTRVNVTHPAPGTPRELLEEFWGTDDESEPHEDGDPR